MAECGDGDSSNGEAVQGPMRDSGPGSSMAECGDGDSSNGRPYRDP
ncbi:unnamed protein product [Staurois parvus]|uniref:Uncharacterized protein n=1 Tax=Staurois parvus TaxID=386267 RepID=A0ABN9G4V4_9NEOB|nr:unnamed protein product [Staurois parvus]